MKYLVLQSEESLQFVVFDGPGYQLTVSTEKCDVPYYVRQFTNIQTGTFSINQASNYSGGSIFTLINIGCNIVSEGQTIPQGISVMHERQKYTVAKLTMFLIDEDDRSEIEAGKSYFILLIN